MEWLDLKGKPVPAETRFSVTASTGLVAVLSIVTPQDRAVGGLTCSISNPLLPEKVTETYLLGEFSSKTSEPGPGFQGCKEKAMQTEPEKIFPSAWPRGSQGCWFPRRRRDRDAGRSTREARKIHPDTGFSVAVVLIELVFWGLLFVCLF